MWVIVADGKVTQTFEEPRSVTIKGVQYPKEVFTKWPEDELRAVGIYEPRYAPAEVPEGMKVLKQEFQVLEGYVMQYDVLVPVPKNEADSITQERIQQKLLELDEHYKNLGVQGMVWPIDGKTRISLTPTDVAQLAMRMATLPFVPEAVIEVYWALADGTVSTLPRQEMITLGLAVDEQLTAWTLNLQRHREQITALTTSKLVDAYDVSTGW